MKKMMGGLLAAGLALTALGGIAAANSTHASRRIAVANVATTTTTTRPVPHTTVPNGAALLAVRRSSVVALDQDGRNLATVYSTKRAGIRDVQLASDHNTLWYSVCAASLTGDVPAPCVEDADIVRVDLVHGTERIVARGGDFALSSDGARLAIARACKNEPTPPGPCFSLWVRDLASGAETKLDLGEAAADQWGSAYTGLEWSVDGSQLLVQQPHMAETTLLEFAVSQGGVPGAGRFVRDEQGPISDRFSHFAWTAAGLVQVANSAGMEFSSVPMHSTIEQLAPDSTSTFIHGAALADVPGMRVDRVFTRGTDVFVVAERYAGDRTGGWTADGNDRLYRVASGALQDLGALTPHAFGVDVSVVA